MKKGTSVCYETAVATYQTVPKYEGWNFNNGNYLFTTDTK